MISPIMIDNQIVSSFLLETLWGREGEGRVSEKKIMKGYGFNYRTEHAVSQSLY